VRACAGQYAHPCQKLTLVGGDFPVMTAQFFMWHQAHRLGTALPVASLRKWPIATEIHVSWNVGDQGKSGPVVLGVSVSHFDPKRP
jgi:hypothetical protein